VKHANGVITIPENFLRSEKVSLRAKRAMLFCSTHPWYSRERGKNFWSQSFECDQPRPLMAIFHFLEPNPNQQVMLPHSVKTNKNSSI